MNVIRELKIEREREREREFHDKETRWSDT